MNKYAVALVNTWEKSFGSNLLLEGKLKKVVKDYYNQVYVKACGKTK